MFFFCLKLWWMTSDIKILFSLIDTFYSWYLDCICVWGPSDYLFLWPNLSWTVGGLTKFLKNFNKNCMYLKCTTWYDTHVHSKMTTVKLINIPSLHIVMFFVCDDSLWNLLFYQVSSVQYSIIINYSHHSVHWVSSLIHPTWLQLRNLDQYLPISPVTSLLVTTVLLSALCVWFL